MALDLSDQVALVTGAGRGIGAAIAGRLSEAGASLVLAARTEAEIEAVAQEIRHAGRNALAVPCDVSDEASVTSLFEQIRSRHESLEILVNNAGVGVFGAVQDFDVGDFDRVMGVNARGCFLCCREGSRMMLAHDSGTIINISSVVGFKGYPLQAAYTASKHAIMGLTRSLAAEVQGAGIRVSAVLPGGVDTDLVRSARPDLDPSELMHPDDVADAVMYLLSLSDRAAVDEIYIRRRSGTAH
jgi:3-oxoacyl-[acyl-carrier protein] reductase